jgi:hypothetical protein
VLILSSSSLTLAAIKALADRDVYFVARLKDAGATLTIAGGLTIGNGEILTDYLAIAADTTMRFFKSLPLHFPKIDFIDNNPSRYFAFTPKIAAKRTTAGAADVTTDFFFLMPRPWLRLKLIAEPGSISAAGFVLRGREVTAYSTGQYIFNQTMIGDVVELVPERYNHLFSAPNYEGGAAVITDTLTYNRVTITPRFALL